VTNTGQRARFYKLTRTGRAQLEAETGATRSVTLGAVAAILAGVAWLPARRAAIRSRRCVPSRKQLRSD
jgi:hypothetical protein